MGSVTAPADTIRERAKAATPGPWFYDGRDIFAEEHGEGGHRLVLPLSETWHESQGVNKADAEFVAHARADVEALLAALDVLERENRWLREALENTLKRAGNEPIGVDISDYSDDFCRGFLAGQENVLQEILRDPAALAAAEEPR